MFPLLLGVAVLALDVYLLTRLGAFIFQKNLQQAISLGFILASAIVGMSLIAYAIGIGRFETLGQRVASPFVTWIGIPLLLAVVALGATIGGMELNRATAERQSPVPCIDLYQTAQGIAKDNPKFRMAPTDRDELRCGINAAIGR